VNDTSASHGRQPKEVLLRSTVIELYPGIENTGMFAVFRKCMEERTAQHFETDFVFPDGTLAWFDLSVQPVPEGIFILSLDITERKRTETALQRYAQRMEMLHRIDMGILRGGSILSLVETTLKQIRQIIPCQRARVAVIDETTNEALVFELDFDGDTALGPGLRIPLPPDFRAGFDARNMQVIDDIRPLQDVNPRLKQLVNEGLLSLAGVLLIAENRLLGSLGLIANTPAFFTAEYQEIVAEITNQLAIGIRQLHLTEEIQQRATELEQNNTSLQQAESSLQRYAQRLEILHKIDVGIIGATSIHAVVETTLHEIRRLIACQQAGVVLFDFATNEVLFFALDPTLPPR
jgi:transcriptional regulator with GAF, ATPase, and Fis domain